MAPDDYKKVRMDGNIDAAWVHERPYLPKTTLVDDDVMTFKIAVIKVMIMNSTTITNKDSSSSAINNNPSIDNLDLSILHTERISGGITNILYKISNIKAVLHEYKDTCPTDTVLVRRFGAEGMIDRDVENYHYAKLAKFGIAPPYWGRVQNGRIEGWIDNMRPLQPYELSLHTKPIAIALANLHYTIHPDNDDEPTLWKQLYDWLQQAENATFQTERDIIECQKLELKTKIRIELDTLKDIITSLASTDANNIYAFCHNDLLAANILIHNEDNNIIQLIDFEYGGINYCTFDIANHFNEYAGGPPTDSIPDYINLFPSHKQQREFIKHYLQHSKSIINKQQKNNNNDEDEDNEIVVTDDEINIFFNEVQYHILINHLYWGLWAINQAAIEGCVEYDYMVYAINRFKQFYIEKEKLQQEQSLKN